VKQQHKQLKQIPLPHEAVLDQESGEILFTIGDSKFQVNALDLQEFYNIVSDINDVVQVGLKVKEFTCPTCGFVTEVGDFDQQNDEDMN